MGPQIEFAINMSHKAEMNRSDRTYPTLLDQFPQALPGKNDVHISIRITVVVIIVRDRQFFWRDGGRNVSEAWITKRIAHIKRGLRPQMHTSGRD
jgi:hypothetical protein